MIIKKSDKANKGFTPLEIWKKISGAEEADSKFITGFTLIELLAAMTIFLIVIVVVLQIFLISINGAWRLFGQQNDLDSARYILESVSKEVRLSSISSADSGGNQATQLNIINSKGCLVSYAFSGTNITRAVTGGSGCTIVSAASLNPSKVLVNGGFYIQKTTLIQPRVTMVMSVVNSDTNATRQTTIHLQTTISSRQYAP